MAIVESLDPETSTLHRASRKWLGEHDVAPAQAEPQPQMPAALTLMMGGGAGG